MFIRLNLWRIQQYQQQHHHLHYKYQYYHGYTRTSNKLLSSNIPAASNVMLWHRHRCDIKRNEELLLSSHGGGTIIIPTPLKIKQTIKSGFHDFIDGYTCIQTSCPTCPAEASTTAKVANATTTAATDPNTADQVLTGDKCLFVNKTTGKSFFAFLFSLPHILFNFKKFVKISNQKFSIILLL